MIAEIHITFDLESDDIIRLNNLCQSNDIKLTNINYKSNSHVTGWNTDTMTSILIKSVDSKHHNKSHLITLLDSYVELFLKKDFKIVRKKIETDIENIIEPMYFESHFFCEIDKSTNMDMIRNSSICYGGLLSYNCKNNVQVIITNKFYSIGKEEFIDKIDFIVNDFKTNGLNIIKVQKEKVIFDSNMDYDNGWIN